MNPEQPTRRNCVPQEEAMSRRVFLRAASATLLAAPLIGLPSSWGGSFRVLTDSEAATLNALCERIIPTDQDPGASWAGVVEFIDRKLGGYHRRYRALYRVGLRGVGESSMALFGREFVDLDGKQQDELLRRLELNQVPGAAWDRVSAGQFFDRLVDHTMQGFYGGPRHGGNRDAVSWHMLGLPTPPVRSRRPLSAAWNKAPATPPQGP
jgi:gluconate 2-dehydrogenase gamma chain